MISNEYFLTLFNNGLNDLIIPFIFSQLAIIDFYSLDSIPSIAYKQQKQLLTLTKVDNLEEDKKESFFFVIFAFSDNNHND